MRALIERLIKRYGTPIRSYTDGKYDYFRGFFQLVTSKSWQNMERMFPACGEIARGQFLLIAPSDATVKPTSVLLVDGKDYIVRRADHILYGRQRLFIWALCVEGGGDDTWSA